MGGSDSYRGSDAPTKRCEAEIAKQEEVPEITSPWLLYEILSILTFSRKSEKSSSCSLVFPTMRWQRHQAFLLVSFDTYI